MSEEKDNVTAAMLKTPQIRPSVQVHGGALPDSATSEQVPVQMDVSQIDVQDPTNLPARGGSESLSEEVRQRGVAQLGTSPPGVEAFGAATQSRQMLPRRAREEGLPERTNLESGSEAVRDYQTQPRRPVDIRQEIDVADRATAVARDQSVQRIAGLLTGAEKGLLGNIAERVQMDLGGNTAVLDALLEAVSLPSTITGEGLAEYLKRSGIDPVVADNLGLAVMVGTSLGYGSSPSSRKPRKLKRKGS